MKKLSDDEIIKEFSNFDENIFSLTVSSVNENNIPLTNYSPFVKDDEAYYICVSSNLEHYSNMINSKKAHILIIEDESTASHIYARKRLYFNATCSTVEDEQSIFELFDARFGESLSFLQTMKDFKIIKLIPSEKSLVLGFGAAYKMGADGKLAHKTISHKN